MIVQTVKFESNLPEEEILRRADERADAYRAVPGLLQKYYVKYEQPAHYGGILIWESKQALAAFGATELAKTLPTTYGVEGAPTVEVLETFDVLRG